MSITAPQARIAPGAEAIFLDELDDLSARVVTHHPALTRDDQEQAADYWASALRTRLLDRLNRSDSPAPIDIVAIARAGRTADGELLEERLNRAIEALIDLKLAARAGDRAALRTVLFELYDASVLTKGEVYRRGEIAPEEFFDLLDAYRTAAAGS
jgi:hypothetical protein